MWFSRNSDNGHRISSDDPAIELKKDAAGQPHLGRLDHIDAAKFYPPKKVKGKNGKVTITEATLGRRVEFDGEGRIKVRVDSEFKEYFVPRSGSPIDPMRVPGIQHPQYNMGVAKGISAREGEMLLDEIRNEIALVACAAQGRGRGR